MGKLKDIAAGHNGERIPSDARTAMLHGDHQIGLLQSALVGMLNHVKSEEFCRCEHRDHTEPADKGEAVEFARFVLGGAMPTIV